MYNEQYRASLSRTEQLLYDRKHKDNALARRLRDVVDLADAYLEDGAPHSALRVLREAVEAEALSLAQQESE